jgi:hypothetical protein
MATVLHLTIQGFINNRNEGQTTVATSFKVARTGLPLISDGPDIPLQMRNGGSYKPPGALNNECLAAVLDYINTAYGVTSFDAIYICGSLSSG